MLAHRRAVDIARREARRRPQTLAEEHEAADSYTTEELVVLREDQRAVQQALQQLPPRKRQLIELAYYAGLAQIQIAERLGIPLGTVKSRMWDALRELDSVLTTRPGVLRSGGASRREIP